MLLKTALKNLKFLAQKVIFILSCDRSSESPVKDILVLIILLF